MILNEIKKHYKFKSDAEFARFLEIKPQTLSSWYSRNTINNELMSAKCVEIDANSLLTGNGEMLKSTKNDNNKEISSDREVLLREMLQEKDIEIKALNREIGELQRELQSKKYSVAMDKLPTQEYLP